MVLLPIIKSNQTFEKRLFFYAHKISITKLEYGEEMGHKINIIFQYQINHS